MGYWNLVITYSVSFAGNAAAANIPGRSIRLECIRSWRSSSGTNQGRVVDPSKASKTCPCCRTPSKYIIPSSVFPKPLRNAGSDPSDDRTPAKEAIVTNYLSQMKRIPCKYFQQSIKSESSQNPRKLSCPFANSCHYSHINPITGDEHVFTDAELKSIRRRASRARRIRNQPRDNALRTLVWDGLPMGLPTASRVSMSYDADDILGWITGEVLEHFHLADRDSEYEEDFDEDDDSFE
ncbi:Makorin-1 [Dactylella cylindrospora]|nr:Makorin-1 [Dactylella cylindrospora]